MKYCNSCEIPVTPVKNVSIKSLLRGKLFSEVCPRCSSTSFSTVEKFTSSRTFHCAVPTSYQVFDERNAIHDQSK